jgi:hypothetical protein
MKFLWHLIVLTLANNPRMVDWLIRRAQRTPYTHIPSRDGQSTYMRRWWLFNAYGKDIDGSQQPARWPWLPSVRIHHICQPDVDRHLHDHPWNARTIVLRGWYVEQLQGSTLTKWRTPGYTGRLLHGQYHRIHHVNDGGTWTLFITWRQRGDWGFLVDGKKVPWRQYLGLENEASQFANTHPPTTIGETHV